ncbi:butyryl-CoA dehydrogenase [Silvibacterium bohemicum]|uniref:Butyryl-CoA dehydrogenase n=1 Tax=Silvibacterium bohemicum TaxID=1577686 RepID=A0A841JPN3_9BACT|nr:acyl-CoA dehydrogenase family protein [Silvibacterium bohemicum]MBB6142385.1 butyryl-CoA dehydrogenase [Silvibacterium bohemicum]
MSTPVAPTPVAPTPVTGGSFLLQEADPAGIFTPEDFSDEQRQIADTTADFAANEILPAAAEIEAKNFDVTCALLRKAGELGLMAVDVPEEYGGLAMDKVTSAIIADRMSVLGSFSVAFSAHTGIGTLPLVWYGTPAQKTKYLPRLASGAWLSSYALSEATSGSDAMNMSARAVRDGDHYVLNGEKMWITNAGFSNLFTIFAKIADPADPDPSKTRMSAFLVERTTPGLSIGPEEHKLGIRGASTCPVILNDCRVPVENLLGEAGKGHHIAFNILNIGRFKLGAACVGGARNSLANAVSYAKERRAFGKAIAEFGLIQQKISDSATRIYVGESMAYRTIGAIDAALEAIPEAQANDSREIQKRIEEFAVECSILKVWGSEMLDAVVDHTLQIYAGYGYVEEYPAERAYRDSRINRIFEGTNEINRLIITGFLMKRALSGQLPLLAAIKDLMDELMSPPSFSGTEDNDDPLAREVQMLANAKKLALFAAGSASQKYMNGLGEQQEIMGALADIICEVYAFDSALARARKLAASASPHAQLAAQMTQLYAVSAFHIIEVAARQVIAAVAEGDMLRTQLAIFRRLVKHEPADTVALSRAVAKAVIDHGRYTMA